MTKEEEIEESHKICKKCKYFQDGSENRIWCRMNHAIYEAEFLGSIEIVKNSQPTDTTSVVGCFDFEPLEPEDHELGWLLERLWYENKNKKNEATATS